MINQPTFNPDGIDGEILNSANVDLSVDAIERAVQLSQTIPDPNQQWFAYLNALALLGFEQWLEGWGTDLVVTNSQSFTAQVQAIDRSTPVCNLEVGAFKLCLIVAGSFADTVVALPRSALNSPERVAHFYVLVEVLEELMQVQIYGYLRYDQLLELQHTLNLDTGQYTEQSYLLPLDWFTLDTSSLLLDLRCLEPNAIMQREDGEQKAEEIQESGVKSEFLSIHPSTHPPIHSSTHLLLQPTINVGIWLSDRLDAVAQELSWMLMSTFTPATGLRSTVADLTDREFDIPATARGAYQDLQLGSVGLRFYVITWALSLPDGTPAWTLLVILEAQPGANLPLGTRLRVRDEIQLLVEQVLQNDTANAYLYAQVGGTWNERFWVTIDLPDDTATTLPCFTFSPEA